MFSNNLFKIISTFMDTVLDVEQDDTIESSGVVQILSKEMTRFLTLYTHAGSDRQHFLRVQLIAVVSPDKFTTSGREDRSADEIVSSFCDILTYKPSVTLIPSSELRLSQFARVMRLVFDFDFGSAFGVSRSDAFVTLERHDDVTRLILSILEGLHSQYTNHSVLFVLSRLGLHLWTNPIAFEIAPKAISFMKAMRDCLNRSASRSIDGLVADQAVLDRQEKSILGRCDKQGVISIPCSLHRVFGGKAEHETVGYVPFLSFSLSSYTKRPLEIIKSEVSDCLLQAISCHIGQPRQRESLSFCALQKYERRRGSVLTILD